MKRIFILLAIVASFSACSYDDSDLWESVNGLEEQVAQNTNDIATLSALIDALNNSKVIISTEYTTEGAVLHFSDGSSVTIKNGADGKDGANGQDGKDGKDGADGKDGVNGENGKDGTDGKDGKDGKDGDSFFVSVEETDSTVIITLADGRVITLPKAADSSEEQLPYELRVLSFEDEEAKFAPYSLDYAGIDITKWSDLIDNPPYGGPLTYGDYMSAEYRWYDEGNTELCHTFPYNYSYCFWGGGHAISNYWGEGWSDEDRDKHIAKYYGEDYVTNNAGNDSMLGWFNLQLMIPIEAHSGDNFVVHYGYKDEYSYIENLPEIAFGDDVARVIDHMWVTNTNYTLNQLYNGVKSEAGNSFGGNWEGLTENAWLKIVAFGFDDVEADAYAEPISEVEFYLVQGENVVTDWQKWDLSGLGAVKKVRFNFLYSDEMGGRYGFTIPGYFAYDDIAVRFDK